jgi:gliding motility-associated lipoprotein GldH
MRAAKILVLLCLTFWACSPSKQKLIDKTFDPPIWLGTDTLWADLELKKSGAIYDIAIEITLTADYPWRNLYLMTFWKQPDGFQQSTRIQLVFQDEEGRWYEPSLRFRTFVARGLQYGSVGRYRMGFLPYVRADSVPEVKRFRAWAYERG